MKDHEFPDFAAKIPEAYRRIRSDVARTPTEFSEPLSRLFEARIFIKWECDQITGSFKLRGALNKLRSLSAEQKSRGIVSASTGNHGLAVGHAARLEGVALRLFLPETVAEAKRKKIESLGISPDIFGASCDRTEAHARAFAGANGMTFVSPYNDWDIICGAATVGVDLAGDVPGADEILVPLGGGGLIAGIGAYMKGVAASGAAIRGVEPETSAFMAASIKAGRLVEIEEGETVADAVAGGIEPGAVTFPLCRAYVDGFLTVPEDLIPKAMVLLFQAHGRKVEAAGALPVAALLESPGLFKGRTVIAVVSGKNISPERFESITGLS